MDLPELDDVWSDKHGLNCPLGQLAGVVLQLVGQDGSALGVQLLSPVDVAGVARVPLVQRLYVHELEVNLEKVNYIFYYKNRVK